MSALRTFGALCALSIAPAVFAEAPATQPSLDQAVRDLTSDDYHQRQDAAKQLQDLLADQIAKRARVQDALDALQAELDRQMQALALVSDPEAHARTAGLLEMERALATWTIDAMTEPPDSRKALLAWGLSKDVAPLLGRVYGRNLKARVQAVADLARLTDSGADWTLARLVNDPEPALRTAAIAGLYDRKPTPPAVAALWYRAIVGPGSAAGTINSDAQVAPAPAADNPDTISIPFPGRDDLQFAPDDDDDFSDSPLATDVLVHMNSPLVAERIKAFVLERKKTSDELAADNSWTLNVHHLIEAYNVKEAVELLAVEATRGTFTMNTDAVDGRPFIWTDRTIAIGVILKLAGQDPTTMGLLHVSNSSAGNDWLWAATNKKDEQQIVQKFHDWWKDHYTQFGLKSPEVAPAEQDAPEENPPPPNNVRGGHRNPPPAPVEAP